jgi:hypothetical protein
VTELDRTLLERVLPAEPAGSSWNDVLHRADRARRRRARQVSALVAAAALLVGVTSAFGGRIVGLFQGEPAPPSVQERVREMATPDPILELMGQESSRVIAEQTHGLIRLDTKAGPFFLWGAPMTGGGRCVVLTFGSLASEHPISTGNCLDESAAKHPEIVAGDNKELPGAGKTLVEYGVVPEGAASAELHLSGGRTIAAPLVERAFLVELPRGAQARDVVARDAAGVVVARQRLVYPTPRDCCPKIASPPEDAYRPLFTVHTDVGDITFSTARGYPNCYSVQMPVVGNQSTGASTCRSAGPFPGIIEFSISPLTGDVHGQLVISGEVRDDVRTIELRFTDGSALPLPLHGRYFVVELPRKHPTEFVARDADGKELRQPFAGPPPTRRR